MLDIGVVDIVTQLGYQHGSAAGTGIIVNATGEILTNNHVVEGATSIAVTVVTTGRTYNATVVGTDPTDDVAVIQLQGASGLHPAKFGDSSKIRVGDAVTAVGNAGGAGGAPSIATGTVQALDQSITAYDPAGGSAEQLSGLIEMNAGLQPGDSGGPLYNASGEVIGMDTAGSTGRRFRALGGTDFAIPIQKALSIASEIEAGHASSTITIGTPGFLGVQVQDLAPGGTSTSGVVITGVVSGTPAERIGLQAGDVITSVETHTVDSPAALSSLLHGHHAGDKISLGWTDTNGKAHTTSVTLAVGAAN